MKRLAVLIGFIVAITLNPDSASAHTELTTSNPSAGGVISAMPATISLEFSENLLLLSDQEVNTLSLIAPNGGEIALTRQGVAQNVLSADLNSTESTDGTFVNGDYTVSYKVVAADGHKVSGEFTFTLANPDAPTPEPSLLIATSGQGATDSPTDSHGVLNGILVPVGVLTILLALAIAYRRFKGK